MHRSSGIATMFGRPRIALHIAPSPQSACDMQGVPQNVSEWTWMQIRKLMALSCCIYSKCFVHSKWVPVSLVCYMLPVLTAAPSPDFTNAYKCQMEHKLPNMTPVWSSWISVTIFFQGTSLGRNCERSVKTTECCSLEARNQEHQAILQIKVPKDFRWQGWTLPPA